MGLIWPDGDEGKLRDAAKAWRTFAKDAEEVRGDTNHSARGIMDVNSGEAVEAFEKFWSRYVGKGEKGWLRNLPEAARDMAKALDELADDIDDTKSQIRSEIVGSAALIAAGIVFTGPTFGISDVAAGAAATRIVTLSAEKSGSLAARAGALFTRVTRAAVLTGATSVSMDLAVAQPARILAGQQDGISLEEVSNAAKYGTLFGGVLGGGHTFAPKAPPSLRVSSLRPKLIKEGMFSRSRKRTPTKGEPVDVATGTMLMEQTDLTLPASLPLVLTRTYLSSHRVGVHFGPSWASTLDERVQIDQHGVVFVAADGMRLVYPVPEPYQPLPPSKGPRWPMEWDGKPAGTITITDPDSGVVRTFADPQPCGDPEAAHLPLVSLRDRNGVGIDIDRNLNSAPLAVRHSGGYHLSVETENQRVTALRLLHEAPDAYAPGSSTPPPSTLVMRYAYDEAGNLIEVVNSSGKSLRFIYDHEGRMLSWTDRNGVTYRYEYDAAGRVVRTIGPNGIYDGAFAYDEAAGATVYTDSRGHRTTCRYNADGQVVAETDPLGNTTRTEWNERGTAPLSVTDPLGHITTYTYDEDDNLTSVHLPDGSHARATYNALHQPLEVTEPGGAVWRHTYDEAGNLTGTVDPAGATTRYGYDACGRLTTATDALGHTRRLTCDAAGLPTALTDALGYTTHVVRDPFGRIVEITDPLGHTTRMAWTTEGNPSRREGPEGARESWTWDGEGNLLTHTDAAGPTTRHTPGPFDAPATRTDADGATYAFAYDTEMRLTRVTNPQGLHWSYAYDAAGRLISETDFNGATLTYELDALGRLTARTNAEDQTIRYTRNALGQVTEQHDVSADATTTFAFDATGELTAATSPAADLALTRDALGRVLSETINGRTTTFAYDALGQCVQRTTPSGFTSTWTYDAESHPQELATDHGILSFTHDAAGRETERRTGSLVLRQEWDRADRLTTQTTRTPTALLQHRDYAYRPDGYVTEIRELTSGTRRYDLNPVGRVTAVRAHGWRETYAYDAAGNLTTAHAPDHPTPGDRTVEGTRLHRAGRTSYTHDAAGRRTSKTTRLLNGQKRTWTYTWSAEDRLTAVTTSTGDEWTYTYDPLGRRISKQGSTGERVTFNWDGTRLAEQTTIEGHTTTWDYNPDTHRPLTQTDHTPLIHEPGTSLLTKLTAPRPRFQAILTDLTGTPTELATPDGEVTWGHRATLWGTPLVTPTGSDVAACPLRFPGQYRDDETSLHYNCFRYYDPETARYVSGDPLGLAPAPNPVTYVSNPHTATDVLGLAPDSCRLATASSFGVPRRASINPKRVFRGDTRDPNDVFSSGFSPKGTNEDIGKYALHDTPSNWVGTSKSAKQAGNFPQSARGQGTWVYEIRGNGYGVDVNRALGGATKSFIKGTGFPSEREVIFRGIDGANIVRAERWRYGRPTGEIIENPRFTNE
ncbi:RHS repeat protein [Streptomyces reniochalinae]|uniref:RHS repeat protein n=2 Tax=Streptomyces reniochalinae TaxID=2250578 RepID=A0A367EAJ9_9ACTN|nr:RHS repeat protein [Streptomyces reniochalinae]